MTSGLMVGDTFNAAFTDYCNSRGKLQFSKNVLIALEDVPIFAYSKLAKNAQKCLLTF